jgi:predicted transport protein
VTEDVGWSQSKVVFISSEFTPYQKEAIHFKDMPIESWEVTKYENDTLQLIKLEAPESSESITTISPRGGTVHKVSDEVAITEQDRMKNLSNEIKELYETLKDRILSLGDNIEIVPRKQYLSFKVTATNFVDAHLQNAQIKLWLNMDAGSLNNPQNMARDVSKIGHWGNGDYEIILKPKDDLNYLMNLVKQSYQKQL